MTNLQILKGNRYELGPRERHVFTFEHVSVWEFGDNFFFFDVSNPDQEETSLYGEYAPSLSLGKIFGRDLSFGAIKDLRLTAGFEFGKGYRTFLYGAGVDLALPRFTFFKAKLCARDTADVEGVTWQATLIWLAPLHFRSAKFLFGGFADFAGREGQRASNQLTAPQFLLDVGSFWGRPGSFFAGIEYQYWRNKFGVRGVTENAAQAMVRFNL